MVDSPAPPRPTLKTISQLTGLAVATVSRALHDAPDIGVETKRRVQETAARIGYRPNRAGVRLRTGKTNVISMVLSTDHDVLNFTARLIKSVVGALRTTPYHLIVTPYYPAEEDPMAPVRYVVETRSADALILNQIQPEDPRVAYLLEKGFPFATHGRTRWQDAHPWFDYDNKAFGRLAAEQLAARGRRHIAVLPPPLGQSYAQAMAEGAAEAAAEAGLAFTLIRQVDSDQPTEAIEVGVAAALEAEPGIDGVICSSINACMAVTSVLEARGRRLGRDADIFSKEAVPFLGRFRPEILTVREDVGTAGAFLARAAMRRIADPEAPPMQGLELPRL